MPICGCGCRCCDGKEVTLRPQECGDIWRKHSCNYTIIVLFRILPCNQLYDRLHYVYMLWTGRD